MQGAGGSGGAFSADSKMSTVSKDHNLALSSEDSSCPDESDLELGLGLSLSRPCAKSNPTSTAQYARVLTAEDFPSAVSSTSGSSTSSASSSSAPSSLSRANVTAGTKRTADSAVDNNGPSQVVGWPPIGAFRMNSFNNHGRSPTTEAFNSVIEKTKRNNAAVRNNTDNGSDKNICAMDKGHPRISLFVKVNMDGLAIGRKVDLSAHSSYESLARTLEDMFSEPTTGASCNRSYGNGDDHGVKVGTERQSKLLDGSSKFVLTYEDKEGDWMLVGDVPWRMFLSSVKRLRIMRTSDANDGLAPRLEEKNSRQKSKHM